MVTLEGKLALVTGAAGVVGRAVLEDGEEIERRANGIPLHQEVVQWFDHITRELTLSPLERKEPPKA